MLCDERGNRLPRARARVFANRQLINPTHPHADPHGWLTVELLHEPRHLFVEWAPASVPLIQSLPYRRHLRVADISSAQANGEARLANLGFDGGRSLEACVLRFQRHYGLPLTGNLDDVEDELD